MSWRGGRWRGSLPRLEWTGPFFYWQELERRQQLTDEDRGYYLKLLLDLKRYDLARPEWESFKAKGERLTSQELMLGLEFLLQTNRLEEAIALLRSALQKHEDQNQRLLLGELLIRSPLETVNKEGFSILQGLSQNSDALGLRAAESLLQASPLPESFVELLIKKSDPIRFIP
jgi:hypothetical protein